jgi:uncharacterized protein (DUF952 family)
MIYHIADFKDWDRALELGEYKPHNYREVGFIHCANLRQLPAVAQRFYSHLPEILILHIVEKRIKPLIKYELGKDVGELFPHIYGAVPLHAIENVSIIDKTENNEFDWQRWKFY